MNTILARMKKSISGCLAICLLITMVFSLSGCGSSKYVGCWAYSASRQIYALNLKSDGTYIEQRWENISYLHADNISTQLENMGVTYPLSADIARVLSEENSNTNSMIDALEGVGLRTLTGTWDVKDDKIQLVVLKDSLNSIKPNTLIEYSILDDEHLEHGIQYYKTH